MKIPRAEPPAGDSSASSLELICTPCNDVDKNTDVPEKFEGLLERLKAEQSQMYKENAEARKILGEAQLQVDHLMTERSVGLIRLLSRHIIAQHGNSLHTAVTIVRYIQRVFGSYKQNGIYLIKASTVERAAGIHGLNLPSTKHGGHVRYDLSFVESVS